MIKPNQENPPRYCAFRMLREYRRLVRFPFQNRRLLFRGVPLEELTAKYVASVLPEIQSLKKCRSIESAIKRLRIEFAKRGLVDDQPYTFDWREFREEYAMEESQPEVFDEYVNSLDPGRDD